MAPQQTPFDYDLEKLPTKPKGLDPRVVQLMLEEARDEWRKMEHKIADLNERVARYEDERSSVNSALILAQKTSDDVIRQAQYKADQMMDEAKMKSSQLADEHRSTLKDLQSDLERTTLMRQKFADDFRSLLKGYLSELDARFPGAATIRRTEPAYEAPAVDDSEIETHPGDVTSRGQLIE